VAFVVAMGIIVPNQRLAAVGTVAETILDAVRKLLRLRYGQHADTEHGVILEAPFRVF